MSQNKMFILHKIKYIHRNGLKQFSFAVDQNEMINFDKMSKNWWDIDGPTKALHSMNKLRVPLIRDGLISVGAVKKQFIKGPKPLKGLKILDVGCGGGILSEPLHRLGGEITGLDMNNSLINLAKNHAEKNNLEINYLLESVEEHCQKNPVKYDVVIASEVIEHITEKEIFLKACLDCLKPEGSIFLTTMNKTLIAYVAGILIAENVFRLLPKGTHDIEKFLEPHLLVRMLAELHCRTQLLHGMIYNVFTDTWSWSSDNSINYAVHGIKE